MTLRIKTFSREDLQGFNLARDIREEVFVKEQNVSREEEFDQFESESKHYLLFFEEQAVATARWRRVGEKIKLERFAVLKKHRGQKLGDFLLQRVLSDALMENQPIYLHAQLKAIPFYERRGFKSVGELFMECEIAHYEMILESN